MQRKKKCSLVHIFYREFHSVRYIHRDAPLGIKIITIASILQTALSFITARHTDTAFVLLFCLTNNESDLGTFACPIIAYDAIRT